MPPPSVPQARQFQYVPRLNCVCGRSLDHSSRKITKSFGWGEISFLNCMHCGSWCQSPRIEDGSLATWYDSDEYQGSSQRKGTAYSDYLADESARREEAGARFARDLRDRLSISGGKVLEIGCATGSLLAAIRDAGHDVQGMDLSPRFVEVARDLYGLNVQVGEIISAKLPENYFDAVLLFGTLSNLSDLPASLRKIQSSLKKGGYLIANFPDASSWIARLYGARFWMFAPSASCFLTTRGCEAALSQAGFTIMKMGCDWQQPSLQKLLHLSKIGWAERIAQGLGLASKTFSFRMPIPGVRIVYAVSRGGKSE